MFTERENKSREKRISSFFWEHRQIGPYIFKAHKLWEESKERYTSIKARQEELIGKFFPKELFITRHVIPAKENQRVITTMKEVVAKPETFLGVRTAYASAKLAKAPWVMQEEGQSQSQIIGKALTVYKKWMAAEEKPEAIIIMENPYGLGSQNLKPHSFVFRLSFIHGITSNQGVIEGRIGTDQLRDLENFFSFRGEFFYEINPFRIDFLGPIDWRHYENTPLSELVVSKVHSYLLNSLNLPRFLARMEALYQVSDHDTVQFQGRLGTGLTTFQQLSADFILGYGIRSPEIYKSENKRFD